MTTNGGCASVKLRHYATITVVALGYLRVTEGWPGRLSNWRSDWEGRAAAIRLPPL
jgi:hypothetical protein